MVSSFYPLMVSSFYPLMVSPSNHEPMIPQGYPISR